MNKRNVVIGMFLLGALSGGCEKIITVDDAVYRAEFIGKKFSVSEDFFITKYRSDIITKNMIHVCGKTIAPKKEAYLSGKVTTFGNYEILGLGNQGETFVITKIRAYSDGPSAGFVFFDIESLRDGKEFVFRQSAHRYGIKNGYIREIE